MKDPRMVQARLERLIRQEQAFLRPRKSLLAGKLAPVRDRMAAKVPEKAVALLRKGFEKAFETVVRSGTPVISKTVSGEKRRARCGRNRSVLSERFTRKKLGELDRSSRLDVLGNQAVGAAEGAVLGVLGIGLPDIPVLIGLLLKTVYETASNYGFRYEAQGERLFILQLLCAAFAGEDEAAGYAAAADRTAYRLDRGENVTEGLSPWMERAAGLLADRLLLTKAVQGVPVIGLAGGLANWPAIGRAGRLAAIKYRKRYLYQILEKLP